jgi:uncharacterized protein (TIGR03067 family)
VLRDLDLLQGSWSVTALEVDGQEMPAAMLASARIVVQRNRFTSAGMGPEYAGTLELDESASPARLDMTFDAGPEKGNVNLGIYVLLGDTWKICLATRGAVRPSTFASTAGSGFAVETLVRTTGVAPAKAKRRASTMTAPASAGGGPPTEFEGEWSMVSGVMDGQPMDKSVTQWVKRVTRGNQTTVYAGPRVTMSFEFSSDSTSSPKSIDYCNTAGANLGKTQYGIYEFEGGRLKICVAAPGAARPTQFESAPGGGATLTVWKRA